MVCVQGLGFVGAAMAVAVANASSGESDEPLYNVIGVDLPNEKGLARVQSLNKGVFPIKTRDAKLLAAYDKALKRGNLVACTDEQAFSLAAVTLVDVHLDIDSSGPAPEVDFENFKAAIRTLGDYQPPDSLLIIETTVPPGTCRNLVDPLIREALTRRELPEDAILIAHSYERVMPGAEYYDSITRFWRAYAGDTPAAADACEGFLTSIIDTQRYPLTRLHSTTASETAKILENTYRAVNIAFIEEWSRFAQAAGVDLFEVINAIRVRPTHNNIMQPGFGVGGYCLTKDPLFSLVGADTYFHRKDLEFPFSRMAVETNQEMPLTTLKNLDELLAGVKGKNILLLGVSYRQDVADSRFSPSETFYRKAREAGANVVAHDPLLSEWPELGMKLPVDLPSPEGFHAVVTATAHREYREWDWLDWLKTSRPLIFDANNVLSQAQRNELRGRGIQVESLGRGTGL